MTKCRWGTSAVLLCIQHLLLSLRQPHLPFHLVDFIGIEIAKLCSGQRILSCDVRRKRGEKKTKETQNENGRRLSVTMKIKIKARARKKKKQEKREKQSNKQWTAQNLPAVNSLSNLSSFCRITFRSFSIVLYSWLFRNSNGTTISNTAA